MKFNFEKAKDIVKKTIIGSAVTAASLTPMKSNVQENTSDSNINKTEVSKKEDSNLSMDPEFYRNQYIKYMKHPSYKERLTKEMYGDEVINEDKMTYINNEYENRLNKIKNIKIEMLQNTEDPSMDSSYYSMINKSIKTSPYAAFHEMQHGIDHNHNKWAVKQKGFEDKKNEFLTLKKILEKYNYFSNSSEIKARLNSLRLKAIAIYGFDLNNDFNINDYEKLRDDKEYKELRFILNLTNEQINELMKYTAENKKSDDTYYHPDWDYNDKEDKA